MDDEFEWDHDDEIVDLDGCEATGDPQLDVLGYQSPSRRGQNLTGFTSSAGDWLARADAQRAERRQRRAAVAQNIAEAKQRREARQASRGRGVVSLPPQPDRLAPHVEQAVERGAVGRPAGWWRVDIAPDGSAQWAKVDQPGAGPQITAHVPAPATPQWHLVPPPPRRRWWQRRRPEEPQPSPGTRIW
jgi:hypothetical protein